MHQRLKLLHYSHSGQLRPHEHTSYLPLAFLLFVVGLGLAFFTVSSYADTPYTHPEQSSVSLTGTVPSPPPKVAATISNPKNGQHFTNSPIIVAGSCPKDTLVQIYKNNIFAGSTPCDDSGNYSLNIDLLFGKNSLTAQVYDVLNQAGPVSAPVIVYYDYQLSPAAPSSFLNFAGAQLLLNTDAAYRGSFPNQNLNVPITVIGGTPPFAINVQWGDASNQVVPRGNNSTFNTAHAYKKPGTYKITLQGTDSKQLVAFLTVAAIINGEPAQLAAGAASHQNVNKILMLWPVYAIAATVLISFWVGEQREKRILKDLNSSAGPAFGGAPATPAPKPPAKPPQK